MNETTRPDIEGELRGWLEAMALKSMRASQRFATTNGLVASDLQAMMLMSAAERADLEMLTPGDLSRHLDLSSGAVTYLVDRLAKVGFAETHRDPHDRRRTRVQLTEAGRSLVLRHDQGLRSVGTMALMDLPDEDLLAASRVLSQLERALDSYAERFEA